MHDGVSYVAGDLITEIEESQANTLVKAGVAEVKVSKKSSKKEETEETNTQENTADAKVNARMGKDKLTEIAKEKGLEVNDKMTATEIAALING